MKRSLILVSILLFASLIVPYLRAELPPLIPREILFGNPEKTSPQLSPDGKYMAYIAPHNGVLNVWVKTVGKEDDRVVTDDRKRGIRAYIWAEDSKHILYIQDRDGDENWHVYSVDLTAPKEAPVIRDLTPFQGIQAQILGTHKKFPDEILIAMNLRDRRLHDVYRINLKTGAVILDTPNPGDVVGWIYDSNFVIRACQAALPDGGGELRIRKDDKSEWTKLISWGPDDECEAITFTKDGKGMYIFHNITTDLAVLYKKDLETGKEEKIFEPKGADVFRVVIHPDEYYPQAVATNRFRVQWHILDNSIKEDFDNISKLTDGDFFITNRSGDDKVWLVSFTKDTGPVYYYAYDRTSKKGTFLFTHQPKLEGLTLAPMKPVVIKARDGLELVAYLTLPVGVPPKNLPLVLNVHGGPWSRDTWRYHPEAQWLANRGYACLQVNFRGSAGFGKKFLNAGNREWGAKMHDDLIDAVNWAIKQGIADPKKIAIYGGSYGGYAALVGAAFTPDVFCCAVDIVGPSNLVTLLKSIPPYWAPLLNMFKHRVGDPDKEKEFLESRSPLFKAHQIRIPLLIAQGANDPRVKMSESEQIVQAVRKAGKEVQYIVFPDEGHGFARPENRMKFYAVAEAFLAKYLGGRAELPKENEKVELR